MRTSGVASALVRMGYEVNVYSLTGRRSDYRRYRPWGSKHHVEAIEPGLHEITFLGMKPAIAHAISRYRRRPRSWMLKMTGRGEYPSQLHIMLGQSDAVIADHSYIAPLRLAGAGSQIPWFLLSHQLEHVLLRQGNAADQQFAESMEMHERRAPGLFADIFACAEEDRNYFRAHDASKLLNVPIIRCGVDASRYAWTVADRNESRGRLGIADDDTVLLFAGSQYPPNIEALAEIKKFVEAKRDFLKARRIRFLILGSMEPAPYDDGIVIATGRVPEAVPYFAAADAGLNPIVRGAGSNVKLFEYLAARLPILSTDFGVRGSGLVAGKDYVAFDQSTLSDALQTLVTTKSREKWRDFAEDVWQRHRTEIEIESSVRSAVAVARGFPAP